LHHTGFTLAFFKENEDGNDKFVLNVEPDGVISQKIELLILKYLVSTSRKTYNMYITKTV
jgi:hypothetical protein